MPNLKVRTKYKIKSYKAVELYMKSSEEFLYKNEPINNLFWEVYFRSSESTKEIHAGNIFHRGKIKLSYIKMTSNYILLSSGLSSAIQHLVDYAKRKKWILRGVLGPSEMSELFAKQWFKSSGKNILLAQKTFNIFETRKTHLKFNQENRIKIVRADNMQWPRIRLWASLFAKESDSSANELSTVKLAREILEQGNMYIFRKAGASVGMAGFGRKTPSRLTINMVYISKEYRGQGYAKKMIFHLINEAKDRGFSKCILFSEKSLENNLYLKIGCLFKGKISEISFSKS